ncbi:hypothetical protein [Novosphingobium colocasiae]|uniref:Uncharacterized protein n=1 Tax=Novosphingobium colocasiae TaxID=1256513 RepID=A0A918UI62_9SPHN|nr:hypothetical protein [Novosphingobium colocasiae]GGZ12117.1 hypothetical protein GCM10011614_29090 [Novosphingobium colocasiae]
MGSQARIDDLSIGGASGPPLFEDLTRRVVDGCAASGGVGTIARGGWARLIARRRTRG